MIYLDSAATSFFRPPQVAEAVVSAMNTMGNASRGTHEAAMAGARWIYETRQRISDLFHGPGPEQVVFTANATQALNMAVKGLLNPGDRAVTTVMEHNSVLRPLYEMEARGVQLEIIGTNEKGQLDLPAMRRAICSGVKAVFCTHASNLTGNVNDIEKIGAWCRNSGAVFVVDGAQTAGCFPIHMENSHIDILCFSGHKGLMGPQGTGGLCLAKDIRLRPLVTGGSGIRTFDRHHPEVMPEALEAGTLNGHGIAGLGAAIEYIWKTGIDKLRQREQALARAFYEGVREIPGIHLYGDFSNWDRAPVVSLNLMEEDASEVSRWLMEDWGICTRSGGHCAPLMHRALGTENRGAVRFSFSAFNRMEEVETAVEALKILSEECGVGHEGFIGKNN